MLIMALIAIVGGFALALAPVNSSKVRVSWPKSGAAGQSSMLLLANQTPHTLDVRFSPSAVKQASNTPDGVLFSTIRPDQPDAKRVGLLITAQGDSLRIFSRGESRSIPISSLNDGTLSLHSDIHGLTVKQNAQRILDWPSVLPPQIDVLATDLNGFDAHDLSASVLVVNDAESTPTLAKGLLIALVAVAGASVLVLLWRDRREAQGRRGREATSHPDAGRRSWRSVIRVSDVIVVLALIGWALIGPATDDDGYYAMMSRNNGSEGYVGNYFQMFNATFAPFTWFWQFLGWWQHLGGSSPFWLRLPSVIAAIVAWFLASRMLDRAVSFDRPRSAWLAHGLLAVIFCTWWGTFAIAARPEGIESSATVIVLALLLRADRTKSLLLAALAAGIAGFSFAAHPTGAVAFGPVLLFIPRLWAIAREGSTVLGASIRTLAIIASGAWVLIAGFADGTLSDLQTAQARFAAVETPMNWTNELNRYGFLLSMSPQGNYAKRAVVLVTLVLLVWFLVAWVASRLLRRNPMNLTASMIGWSTGLSFIALWISPSKWSHHFGTISSLGPLFIVAFAALAPRLVKTIAGERKIAPWLMPVAAATLVPPMALALFGPNTWPYMWNQGFPQWTLSVWDIVTKLPTIVRLGAVVLALALIVIYVWRLPGRLTSPRAFYVPIAMITVFFVGIGGFVYGSFALATVRTLKTYSPSASVFLDPLGKECRTEKAIHLWDGTKGTPVAGSQEAYRSADNSAFGPQLSQGEKSQLPAGVSLPMISSAEGAQVGSVTTGWMDTPSPSGNEKLAIVVNGDLVPEGANSVTVEFGDGSRVSKRVPIVRPVAIPGWNTYPIDIPQSASSEKFRVQVSDTAAKPGADVAVSVPVLVSEKSMNDMFSTHDDGVVAWQSNFWFPCENPSAIEDGIIQPPAYSTSALDGGVDNIWVEKRGGIMAGPARTGQISTPYSEMTGYGPGWGNVFTITYPYAKRAYDVKTTSKVTWGWRTPFDEVSQLVQFDRDGHKLK